MALPKFNRHGHETSIQIKTSYVNREWRFTSTNNWLKRENPILSLLSVIAIHCLYAFSQGCLNGLVILLLFQYMEDRLKKDTKAKLRAFWETIGTHRHMKKETVGKGFERRGNGSQKTWKICCVRSCEFKPLEGKRGEKLFGHLKQLEGMWFGELCDVRIPGAENEQRNLTLTYVVEMV